MAAATEEEIAALELFREEISDVKLNQYQSADGSLLRWLRARDLDVQRAARMLRRSLEWRETEKINEILEWEPPQIILDEFHMKLSGFDDDGCPIGIIPFGTWDLRKIVEMKHKQSVIRYIDQLFEFSMRLIERRSTKDKFITQFIMIMDLDGFSFRQIASRETIDTIFEAVKRFEANHPETLKFAYLVNAPRVFAYLFSFIKPLLTARTLSKVQIFGSNGSQWKSVLLKNISPDQLPSEFGGSNTTCTDYVVSEGFDRFDRPIVYDTFPENEMSAVTIDTGKKFELGFQIDVIKSRLSWNFKTEKHDVGFAVLYENKELVKISRTDSNVFVQKGAIVCDNVGTYTLVFDNGFSRFRSKQLKYTVVITPPLNDKSK